MMGGDACAYPVRMGEIVLNRAQITDDDLAMGQPAIRAVVHERLEAIYAICEPHIRGDAPRIDPRMVEMGMKATKELKDLWQLNKMLQPTAAADDLTPREIAIAKAKADLLELEARQG